MKITHSINLANARRLKRDPKAKKIKKTDIAVKLYPNMTRRSALTHLCKIEKSVHSPSMAWVSVLTRECGVDANFLFGLPSKHDKDYVELILKKNL